MTPKPRHLYVVGAAGGYELQTKYGFDISKPFAGCLICGAVYQSSLDREFSDVNELIDAQTIRTEWRVKHEKTHSNREHMELAISGRWCTARAAEAFAPYGIIALSDMVMSDEHEDALLKSKPIPLREVEG